MQVYIGYIVLCSCRSWGSGVECSQHSRQRLHDHRLSW